MSAEGLKRSHTEDLREALTKVAPHSLEVPEFVYESHDSSGETEEQKILHLKERLAAHSRTTEEVPTASEKLSEIRTLSRADRPEAIAKFKSELLTQQESWVQARTRIEEALENNPDMPKVALLRIVDESVKDPTFTLDARQLAEDLLDDYFYKRSLIIEKRAEFPNDIDLVNHLTGMDFKKDASFAVKMGPMAIEIYADHHDVQRMYERSHSPSKKNQVGGFAGTSEDGAFFSVIERGKGEDTLQGHEQQHQVNKLFRRYLDERGVYWEENNLFEKYSSITDEEEKKEFLRDSFKPYIRHAHDRAKDELFAYFKEGSLSVTMAKDLFAAGRDPDYYDYLKELREKDADDPLWKEVSDAELISEYSSTIERGVEAMLLLNKTYSKEETISFLTAIPLRDWPKATLRMYKEKLSDPTLKDVEELSEDEETINGMEKSDKKKEEVKDEKRSTKNEEASNDNKKLTKGQKAVAGALNLARKARTPAALIGGAGLVATAIPGVASATGFTAFIQSAAPIFGYSVGTLPVLPALLGIGFLGYAGYNLWKGRKELWDELRANFSAPFTGKAPPKGGGSHGPAPKKAAPAKAAGGGDHGVGGGHGGGH